MNSLLILYFENLQHDYPQTIRYKKSSKHSLWADISGIMNGKMTTQTFPMKNTIDT